MNNEDRRQFSELLVATMEVYGMPLGPNAIGVWWAALERYPLSHVRAQLSAHIQDPTVGKFAPKPADIIGRLQAFDGRPGPEEAWAIVAPTIGDESVSIVWTDEMAQAWGVARELEGDRVASRMAFLERYRVLVQEARAQGIAPHWTPSLGHDPTSREAALLDAVAKGRLAQAHVVKLLPYRDVPHPDVQALIDHKETNEEPA